MADDDEYEPKKECINLGKNYETSVITYLCLKLTVDDDVTHFRLWTDDKLFGKFDDVIVEVQTSTGCSRNYAIQLKYNSAGDELTIRDFQKDKGHFSLKEYFHKCKTAFTQNPNFCKFDYVLYTNKRFEPLNAEISLKGMFKMRIKRVNSIDFLHTSGNVYKFEIVESDWSEAQLDNYVKFFTKFYLCTNQKNIEEINRETTSVFKLLYNCQTSLDTFSKFLNEWSSKEKRIKIKKEFITLKLAECILAPYVKPYRRKDYAEKERLLKEAFSRFDVIVATTSVRSTIERVCSVFIDDQNDNENNMNITNKEILEYSLSVQHPLIVEMTEKDVEGPFQAALRLNIHGQKLILLTDKHLGKPLGGAKILQSLADLASESDIYQQIVPQLKYSIQGRGILHMGEILGPAVQELVNIDDLIGFLDKPLLVVAPVACIPAPFYIERQFSRIYLDLKSFDDVADTLVVLDGYKPEHDTELVPRLLRLRPTCDDTFEVTTSRGVTDMRKFVVEKQGALPETELLNRTNNLTIIIGDPGIGKSSFMKHLQIVYAPQYWVVKICGKSYSNTFCNNSTVSQFFATLGNTIEEGLATAIVKFLEKERRIVVLWDALNEVSEKYSKHIIQLIKQLDELGFRQFITSRFNLKHKLEEELQTLAHTMLEFDEVEGQEYINHRLGDVDKKNFSGVVDKVPSLVNFLRNPLQLYMLTELFQKKGEKFLNKTFSIVDLYCDFVEEQVYMHYATLTDNSILYAQNRHYLYEKYETVSLKVFLEQEIYQHLINKNYCEEFLDNIKNGSNISGIIHYVDAKNMPHFTHISYAEYFVASFLSKNYKLLKHLHLHSFFFDEKFDNVRFMFDLLLAEGSPAHLAVLNKNYHELDDITSLDKSRDKGGRNPLHLLCSWGNRSPLLPEKYDEDDDETEIFKQKNRLYARTVQKLAEIYELNDTDGVFGMSVLDYANKSYGLVAYEILRNTIKRAEKRTHHSQKGYTDGISFNLKKVRLS